jgi:hypothetical protein
VRAGTGTFAKAAGSGMATLTLIGAATGIFTATFNGTLAF